MNMSGSADWSSLLEKSIRPHKGELAIARRLAANPPPSGAHLAIAGVDEDVAALLALRGPAECKDFFPAMQRLMTDIGKSLTMFPASVDAVSMMTLFCLQAFSETVATPLETSRFDVDGKLDEILAYRDASSQDRITAILISFGFDRVDAVKWLPSDIDVATASLIKQLAVVLKSTSGKRDVEPAWDAYLRAFPRMLSDESAEWRHLLLAARLVLGKLRGVPVGEVAGGLHLRIQQLAADEST